MSADAWPITMPDVLEARRRIAPYLERTPLRRYAPLDAAVGSGISVFVKHENHLPTNAFKVRNNLAVLAAFTPEERRAGAIAATRGNHGQGLAWAGLLLGIPVTVCVPLGNNPEKNEAIRGFGALLIEEGRDYDESVAVARRLAQERGLRIVHSTNERFVIAGAATLTLEMIEQEPSLEAVIYSVGGGSQAVGGLTVIRALRPGLPVYGVQAAKASATHDSWHAGKRLTTASADTIADGLATRSTYDLTFEPLREGLQGFVAVEEREIAEAIRILLSTTHNLAEGAGAAGLAGLLRLRKELAGKKVGIVISGGNIDRETLRRVLDGTIEPNQ
jgi:threonine dehydratase